MAFSAIICSSDSQNQLVNTFIKMIKKNMSMENLRNELKKIAPQVFLSNEV